MVQVQIVMLNTRLDKHICTHTFATTTKKKKKQGAFIGNAYTEFMIILTRYLGTPTQQNVHNDITAPKPVPQVLATSTVQRHLNTAVQIRMVQKHRQHAFQQ
jgi:hypothetical protein